MIIGIGVDTIEIERFALWYTYSQKKLLRIFSQEEIDYCLSDQHKSAQRFAVRFAAREALYKALSYVYPDKKIPFLTLCSHTIITKKTGLPQIVISDDLGIDTQFLNIHLSLSHSRTIATAFVVIEQYN
jgi:holo-[acyl-carrier protein] synthase